jgi:hypothetical protein
MKRFATSSYDFIEKLRGSGLSKKEVTEKAIEKFPSLRPQDVSDVLFEVDEMGESTKQPQQKPKQKSNDGWQKGPRGGEFKIGPSGKKIYKAELMDAYDGYFNK